jgi:hypothetical protein
MHPLLTTVTPCWDNMQCQQRWQHLALNTATWPLCAVCSSEVNPYKVIPGHRKQAAIMRLTYGAQATQPCPRGSNLSPGQPLTRRCTSDPSKIQTVCTSDEDAIKLQQHLQTTNTYCPACICSARKTSPQCLQAQWSSAPSSFRSGGAGGRWRCCYGLTGNMMMMYLMQFVSRCGPNTCNML